MGESITEVGAEPAIACWGSESSETSGCRVVEETAEQVGCVMTPSGRLSFANLSGTPPEMARQLGIESSMQVGEGPVPFYTTYLAGMLRDLPVGRLTELADWATRRYATADLVEGYRRECREVVEAFAQAGPLTAESMMKAYALPETLLWLVGTAHRMAGQDGISGRARAGVGRSTSAVVRAPSSQTLYHARNFDWVGIGYWEKTPAVHCYHPDVGLDYLSVCSAGVLGGGLTAMNSSGLTLTAHQHLVERFDLEGVPVGVAGDRVMRRARSIEEAVDILRDHPPVAGWSYVLTEGDTGECAVYETIPGDEHLYRLPGEEATFGHANTFVGERLQEAEIDVFPEYTRESIGRRQRLEECFREVRGGEPVGAVEMAEILGDFSDPTDGKRRLAGRTIASVHTLSSVVFEPENRRVWVGAGPSPASRSWMVPFRIGGGGGGPDRSTVAFHPSPGWTRTPHGRAFELYRKACVRASEGESDKRLLIQVEHALALYPEDPSLHMLAGLLALRNGRGRRAEGAFRGCLERLEDMPRRAEARLYLAYALDLQGQRSSARQMYADIVADHGADRRVVRRAKFGRWWAFSESRARHLPLDFIHVGAV